MNIPSSSIPELESSIADGTFVSKLDSIHGLDSDLFKNAKRTKIIKTIFGLCVEKKLTNINDLEIRLCQLEVKERAQSIDIKALVQELSNFQIHFFKKLEELDSKVDINLSNLEVKCEKLEKVLIKYSS